MERAVDIERVGGHVALDFANTAAGRDTDRPAEHLPDSGALMAWLKISRTVDEASFAQVRSLLADDPDLGSTIDGTAKDLREAIYRTGHALAHGCEPDPCDLRSITHWAARAFAEATPMRGADGLYRLDYGGTSPDVAVLGPIALAMTELLGSPDVRRIGQCEGDGCGWLFVDRSRTGRRRWCDMRTCGNRSKARRHRARG